MGWNTAKDASGTTYYWNEAGASQYERPADFDEKVAQDAGSYTQYQSQPNPYSSGGGSGGGYGGGGGGGGYGGGHGGGYAQPANDYSNIGLQYSRPTSSYRDVQDSKPDLPADSSVAEYWRKNDIKVYGGAPPPFLSFDQAQLPPQMMAAIAKAGFTSPSVIQAQTWPSAMAKRDIIGVAKTGSGKTLGFLVPGFLNVIQMRANPQMGPSILVLAPTRELASQIDVEAQKFGLPLGIRSVCVYGGAPKGGQLSQLRQGAHCVIGTPGRVNDFREGGQLQLNQVMYLVMDEADRMLDMGFEPQIRKIVSGGIRLDRLLKQRILDPLGMVDTGWFVSPERMPRLAMGLPSDPQVATMWTNYRIEQDPGDATYFKGGAGLAGTTGDRRDDVAGRAGQWPTHSLAGHGALHAERPYAGYGGHHLCQHRAGLWHGPGLCRAPAGGHVIHRRFGGRCDVGRGLGHQLHHRP